MPPIVDKKKKIFGNIAAAKTLTEGLPKLKTSSSLPSINNGGNSISFLTDLITSLIGFGALIVALVNLLTDALANIEREIKIALKQDLKGIVSCGIDPSLPNFLKSTGTGIIIETNKIDFYDLFKIAPNSTGGNLLYMDITSPLSNSTDFNTFLYSAIQNDGVTQSWKGILDITFNSIGSGLIPNNTFKINANLNYDSKTLTDFNNDFIDSLTLFNSDGLINRIVDSIYGSISVTTKKTSKQLEIEEQINNVIDNITNSDENDIIDDSYFTFTNEEVQIQQTNANSRKNGIVKLDCCNKIAASIPVSFLSNLNNEMSSATTRSDKTTVISTNLNKMANQNTINNNNPTDDSSIKINFIEGLIKNLVKSIINVVLSPKVIMIFLINYKIVYGQNATFNDAIDFISKNRNLIKSIMKKISTLIITFLVTIALKQIAELVAANTAKKQIEKAKNQLSQLLSLVGVPQDALRIIRGLT